MPLNGNPEIPTIVSLVAIITLGGLLKAIGFASDRFWAATTTLTYYVLFPSLLILKLSHVDFLSLELNEALFSVIGSTGMVAVALLMAQRFLSIEGPLFSSMFQGGIRYNSYVFLAMGISLCGDQGVSLSALFIAVMIVITNLTSVAVLSIFGRQKKHPKSLWPMVLRSIATNPLILAVLIGLGLGVSGMEVKGPIAVTLERLGAAALPLSLLAIGASLKLTVSKSRRLAIVSSTVIKLFVLPATTLVLLNILGVTGVPRAIALIYASVPCAGNAYALAVQQGGDSEVMASIITMTTVMSVFSMPLIITYCL